MDKIKFLSSEELEKLEKVSKKIDINSKKYKELSKLNNKLLVESLKDEKSKIKKLTKDENKS